MIRIYGLIALAAVLLIAIFAITAGAVLGSIRDDTDGTNETIAAGGVSLEDAIRHHLVTALDSGDGRPSVHLNEYDLNELLYAIAGKLGGGSLEIKSIYIERTDGEHRLCIPIRVGKTDSFISGSFSISEEGDTFFIEMGDVSVGNLSINSPLVAFFGIKSRITGLLKDKDISAYFRDDDFVVQLSREDIGKIISLALSDDSNAGLVNAVYSLLMISGDAVDIDVSSPTDIYVSVDMTVFNGRPTPSLDGLNRFTEELLLGGAIDRGGIGAFAKYYLNGYQRLNDEEKARVIEVLSAKSSHDEISSYGGIIERESISLISVLLTQLEINTDTLLPGFKIGEQDVNAMLSELPLVGMVWQYSSYRDDSCAYIAVQSFYCAISDGRIDLYIDFNINGYLITVCADFITDESPITAVSGRLSSARLGNIALNGYEIEQLFAFLDAKLKYDWIYTDPISQTLTLDFSATFKENNVLYAIIKSSKRIVTVCKSGLLSDGGYVFITLKIL